MVRVAVEVRVNQKGWREEEEEMEGWPETEGGSITRTRGFGWNDESKSEVSDPMIGKRGPAN